jgi:hypothetical protein
MAFNPTCNSSAVTATTMKETGQPEPAWRAFRFFCMDASHLRAGAQPLK